MPITCPGCNGVWVPGSKKAAATLYCPSCRHMPALCRVASSAPPAQLVEARKRVFALGTLRLKDVATVFVSLLVVGLFALGAFGSAWALRAKSAPAEEPVDRNDHVAIAITGPSAREVAGPESTALPKPIVRTERIAAPRELIEAMPAPINLVAEEKAAEPPVAQLPAAAGPAAKACGAPDPAPQGHGASVEFASGPADALKQAGKEHKLVFLLHISGNFEESGFT
jgi:hypothetical protein